MGSKRQCTGHTNVWLFLAICILLKILPGSNGSRSDDPDGDTSCENIQLPNDIQVTCDFSNAHGSTCTFRCTRPGYSLCRQCPLMWICNEGSWSSRILPSCCETVDTDPPVFSGPDRIVVFAEERRLTAEVDYHWEPVKATDTVSGDINATLVSIDYTQLVNADFRPSFFYEGVHRLVYQARDQAGNVANFTIELLVEVVRCDAINSPLYLDASCTHSNVLGSSCDFRCPAGFCIVGESSVVCENIGNRTHPVGVWNNNVPTCQYVHCPELLIPFNGNFVNDQCTTHYGDICEMACNPGFSLASGNTVRQCQAIVGSACNSGYWTGQHPRCEDGTPPQFSSLRKIYLLTERQQMFAILHYYWEPVLAVDNVSGNIVANLVRVNSQPLVDNLKPTTLNEGLHTLEYEAEDEAGNKASGIVEVVVSAARCPEPEPGSFDSITCSHQNIYGSTCTFTCATGKCLIGSNAVTCFCIGNPYQPQGEWDNPLPTCQPAGCTELTPPANGFLVPGSCSPTHGSTCEVACNPGYRFQDGLSVRTVQCWVDENVSCNEGYWRGSSICLAEEPPVFSPEHNWIEVVTAEPGETKVVVDYSWEPVIAFDTASREIVATLTRVNSVLVSEIGTPDEYPEGNYTLTYEAEDEHGNNATWSMQLRVRVIRCSNPPPIENGDIVCLSSDHLLGSLCAVFCNDGYCLQSSHWIMMTCVEGGVSDVGVWTVANPSCQIRRCPDIYPPVNGYIVSNSSTCSGSIGNRCEMACNVGYQAQGDDVRYCQIQVDASCNSNMWSGQPLQCQVISCSSLEEEFPSYHTNCNKAPGTDVVGTRCQWHCPDGYRSIGSDVSTCLADGNWDHTGFSCEPAMTCPALGRPQNIAFTSEVCSIQPSDAGTACRFRCQAPGYMLQDPDGHMTVEGVITCSESGLWLPNNNINDFQCVVISCPSLEEEFPSYHTNCNKAPGTDVVGTRCQWRCPDGYRSIGSDVSTCLPDGTWDHTDFTCEPAAATTCPALAVSQNIAYFPEICSIQPSVAGDSCRFRCREPGFNLRYSDNYMAEEDVLTCSETGLWIPSVDINDFQCVATHCSPFPDGLLTSPHVQVYCTSSNSIESSCTFYCSRQGYAIQGISGLLICQADGSWNMDVSLLELSCKDNQRPSVDQCPNGEIHGVLSAETLLAEVHFEIPQASDNSRQTLRVETTPPGIKSPYNFTTDTLVTYVFYDEAGYSASCSFQVTVQNNLPPTTDYCPDSEELHFASPNDVIWQLPEFNNPVTGEAIDPVCSRQTSDDLQPGVHTITCSADNPDSGISSQCEFNITVRDNLPCDMLPTVNNGDWTCTDNSCTLTCAPNHDVKHGEPTVFTCGDSGWLPPVSAVPLCQEFRIPNKLKQSSDASFTSNVDCSGTGLQQFLQGEVKKFIDESAVDEPCHDMCHVQEDITVECKEDESINEDPAYQMVACFSLEREVPPGATKTDVSNDRDALSSWSSKIVRNIEEDNFHPNVANMFVGPRFNDGRCVEVGETVPVCSDGLTPAKTELGCIPCDETSSCEP